MKPLRTLLWVAAWACLLSTGVGQAVRAADEAAAGAAPEKKLLVALSATSLGGPAELTEEAPKFVSDLAARAGLDAKAAVIERSRPRPFHQVDAEADPASWVSGVSVTINKRREWLGFLFAGAPGQGRIVAASRRPCNLEVKGRVDQHTPGPYEAEANAVRELAADLEVLLRRGPTAPRGPAQIVIRREAPALGGDALLSDETEPAQPLDPMANDALQTLAFAAAAQAGFSPTLAEAPVHLTFKIGQRVTSFDISLTAQGPDKAQSHLLLASVPQQEVYPYLVQLCSLALGNAHAVVDMVGISEEAGAQVLAGAPDMVTAADGGGRLYGMDMKKREAAWSSKVEPRTRPRFAAAEGAIYRVDGGLGTMRLSDGGFASVAQTAPEYPWSFAALGEGGMVVAGGPNVALWREDKKVWSFAGGLNLEAGPAISAGKDVLVGEAGGVVSLLDGSSGSPRWQKPVAGRPIGAIHSSDKLAIVGNRTGLLQALQLTDGAPAWQYDLGDVPAGPLLELPDALVAVSRAGKAVRLDGATGKETAALELGAWVLGQQLCPGKDAGVLAVALDQGRLQFVTLPDLKKGPLMQLPCSRITSMVYVPKVTLPGDGEGALPESGPGLLVGGREGFVYVIALARVAR